MGDKLPIFWALFDATTDLPYLKKMLPENVLAIFDNESDVKAVKLSNSGTDYKAVYITSCSKYDALLAENAVLKTAYEETEKTLMSLYNLILPKLRAENAELVAALEFVGAKVKSSGRCHPGAVQYLLAEGLEAVDAALAKHRGDK